MKQSTPLTVTRFGDPLLRTPARRLTKEEILSDDIQQLISDMRYFLSEVERGVGLAAPQVGRGISLSIIAIKSLKGGAQSEPLDMVIINPIITAYHGKATGKWEACISCGSGDDLLYAKAKRHHAITLEWDDERGVHHEERLEGFPAHVAQHEVDHLNGVLFVDRVADPKTFMMADEYRRRVVSKRKRAA